MKTTTIQIEKPCSENWDNMTPNEKGRFCASCEKTVIDFTQQTSEEISAVLKSAKGEVCGKTIPSQLNTPILAINPQNSWELPSFNKAAGLLVAASLVSTQSVYAQVEESVTPAKTEQQSTWSEGFSNSEKIDIGTQLKINETVFEGGVSNIETEQEVVNAKVIFVTKDKLYTTYTNAEGKFELNLPTNVVKAKNILVFEFDDIVMHENKDPDNRWGESYHEVRMILSSDEINSPYSFKVRQYYPVLGGLAFYNSRIPNPIVYVDGVAVQFKKYTKERYPKSGEPDKNPVNELKFSFSHEYAEILYGKETERKVFLVFTQATK